MSFYVAEEMLHAAARHTTVQQLVTAYLNVIQVGRCCSEQPKVMQCG